MSVSCEVVQNMNKTICHIKVAGVFDHELDEAFANFYDTRPDVEYYIIDLRGVETITGSALGMLLTLRSHVHPEGLDCNIKLVVGDDNRELKRLVSSLEIRSLFHVLREKDLLALIGAQPAPAPDLPPTVQTGASRH